MKKHNLLYSFYYAFRGIITAIKEERNMKIHVSIATLVVILGLLLTLSKIEWFSIIIIISLVISAEIFNTAIETVVNLVSPKYNELAKKAKDLSAGAVLVLAICSVIIGLIIFMPKFLLFFRSI